MADEKLNVSPEKNPQPSLFDTGPADAPAPETPAPEPPAPENIPEQAAVDAPAQDAPAGAPGEVSVSADQIEKLMAEQRAAGRAEVEKNEPPEPEQPPTPAPEDKAAEDKGPAKKGKTTGEKTPEPEKPKAKRGRKPKEEKAGPGEPGGTGARKGRPPKADKAAPDKPPSPPRDKMSQSKGAKAATVKGREEAPAAPAPEPPPRPVEEQKIVYLKISELNPFHTFRQHPFKVVDDSPRMQELVTSIKAQGVFTPATVRPEKDGSGYEIVAGHCRCRGSELAGLTELPCIVREMTDHEAVQEMKNSNKQRGEPLPSELARLLDLEMEDIKHQGARMKDVAEGDIGKRSAEIVGENNGMNYKKVMRYIRLNYLVPELLDKVDENIKKISASTEQMMKLDLGANCPIHTKDEIGTLAQNINDLYSNLLSTIEHLEREKDAVRDMERAKVDFLRAASHELKTPVTALNATLENMILGVGKYQDYAAYLPECKEMVEQLSGMIHEILETSKLNLTAEAPKQVDVSELLAELCEPCQLIAAAHQITFSLDLPEQFSTVLPVGPFSKAVSNILANAIAYTEAGKNVFVYMEGRSLVVENKCKPIPDDEIRRLFEPFYRPDFSRSRESGGNGLGLHIVDTLLTSMDIPYSFAPMKSPPGMCFTIQL